MSDRFRAMRIRQRKAAAKSASALAAIQSFYNVTYNGAVLQVSEPKR